MQNHFISDSVIPGVDTPENLTKQLYESVKKDYPQYFIDPLREQCWIEFLAQCREKKIYDIALEELLPDMDPALAARLLFCMATSESAVIVRQLWPDIFLEGKDFPYGRANDLINDEGVAFLDLLDTEMLNFVVDVACRSIDPELASTEEYDETRLAKAYDKFFIKALKREGLAAGMVNKIFKAFKFGWHPCSFTDMTGYLLIMQDSEVPLGCRKRADAVIRRIIMNKIPSDSRAKAIKVYADAFLKVLDSGNGMEDYFFSEQVDFLLQHSKVFCFGDKFPEIYERLPTLKQKNAFFREFVLRGGLVRIDEKMSLGDWTAFVDMLEVNSRCEMFPGGNIPRKTFAEILEYVIEARISDISHREKCDRSLEARQMERAREKRDRTKAIKEKMKKQ